MGIKINYCESYEEMSSQAAEIVKSEIKAKANLILSRKICPSKQRELEKQRELNRRLFLREI